MLTRFVYCRRCYSVILSFGFRHSSKTQKWRNCFPSFVVVPFFSSVLELGSLVFERFIVVDGFTPSFLPYASCVSFVSAIQSVNPYTFSFSPYCISPYRTLFFNSIIDRSLYTMLTDYMSYALDSTTYQMMLISRFQMLAWSYYDGTVDRVMMSFWFHH